MSPASTTHEFAALRTRWPTLSEGRAARRARLGWLAATLVVALGLTAVRFHGVLAAGFATAIPSIPLEGSLRFSAPSDQRWVVWVVSRNARVLGSSPTQLFDAEQCYPERRSLAFGEPAISMGLLGVPAWLLSRDPVATYNVVLWLMSIGAALAMYWLVVEWTGVPIAGFVAGLFFAFQGVILKGVIHPYSSDTTWLVLALLFAHRWLGRGRWADALCLSVCIALQMGTAFYSMVAAVLIGLPFAAEGLIRNRARRVQKGQLALIVLISCAAAALIFGPYLRLETSGDFADRSDQFFSGLGDHLPGGAAWFGALPTLLALIGLFAPRAVALAEGERELRPGLVVGALLCAWIAAGPQMVFGLDLYALVAATLPGFDSVRVPLKIAIGVHPVLCIASGLGVAAGVRALRAPPAWSAPTFAAAAVALIAYGLLTSNATTLAVRPPDAQLRFYAQLSAMGDTGSLFEVPHRSTSTFAYAEAAARRILLSAYHHRPVSACYPSHFPESQRKLERLYATFPDRGAVEEIRQLGFTTLVVHPPGPAASRAVAHNTRRSHDALRALAAGSQPALGLLLHTPELEAYALIAPPPP